MDFNKLLQKQIKKYLTEQQLNDPSVQNFLTVVNDSYTSFERDKELLNHAFTINEKEYQKLYQDLNQEYELKKVSIERLKEAVKEIDQENEVFFNPDKDDLLIIVAYLNEQIVQRKETEHSLSKAHKLLTTLLSNLNSGILVVDENEKISFMNQRFCNILSIQVNAEQLIGTDYLVTVDKAAYIFKKPEELVSRVSTIMQHKLPVFADELELIDGRILERDYIPIFIENEYKGYLWNFTDITERKNHENQLIDLTNIQNGILNGTDYGIIYTDTNGIIKSFNRGAENMLGYTAEEMVNVSSPAIFHVYEEIEARAKALSEELGYTIEPGFLAFNAKARNNVIETNEWTYIKKNGERLTVLLSVSCIRNSFDEIIGFLGISRDITEQKEAQEALTLSEERYRNIVEKSTDVIYKTDRSGFFTFINPVAERITGYKREELLKKHFSLLIKEENKKDALVFYHDQVKQRKRTTYYEFPIITKSGEERWIGQSVQLSELKGRDFELTALAIDITERKNYERTIFLQKEKYQNIITNMNLGLLEVDLEDRIQFINPSFTAISGYGQEELMGKKASELFVSDSHINLVKEKAQQRSQGISDMYEFPAKNKKGELRWWMISGAPNYDDKGNLIGSIGIHLDITAQKRLELELELARSKAEESSKAKEAFLANMSHEIRTPLSAIIGMIRELAKEKLSDKQNQYVHNTSVASQHLLSVLNNILDISKIEAGELQLDLHHFSLTNILNDIQSILINKANEKGLYLKINHQVGKNFFFIGDSSRFRQIFLNLVGNAIKFTHAGGVSVTYDVQDLYEGFQAVYISITDTGVGMEESYLKNIFAKFSQEDSSTSRKYGGSGLGMAITHELIQLMNGTIVIRSKKNTGTTVDIKFLLPKGDASKVEDNTAIEEPLALEHARILLVEDNEFNREVACNTLRYYNCDITEAQDGQEALDKVKSGEQFDLILMDLQMPVMDGFEAAKKIRNELNLNIPIIALTANAFKSELEQCIKAGMNDYVTKPFEEDKLISTISKWLHRTAIKKIKKEPVVLPKEGTKLYNLDKFFGESRHDTVYIQKMIGIFIEQALLSIDQIKQAYHVKDLDTVFKIAHRIKPSIDGLGIELLRNEIREIEKNAKAGKDSENMGEQIVFLFTVLTKVINQLKEEN